MLFIDIIIAFCYDQADRLIASSDTKFTNAQYDSHGNTTSLGDSTLKTQFTYDTSDRNTGVKETKQDNGQTITKTITYTRDVQNRIVGRSFERPDSTNPTQPTTTTTAYGFTGSGDSPDFTLNPDGTIKEKYLTLPGDVIATIRPERISANATTYSLPNIHGDIFATINTDGTLTGTYLSGPFGEKLTLAPTNANTTSLTTSRPQNTLSASATTDLATASWSYVGQHQKLTEDQLTIEPTLDVRLFCVMHNRKFYCTVHGAGTVCHAPV